MSSQVSTPCRPAAHLPSNIHDVIRLKNWLIIQWQVTRDPDLKAQVSHLGGDLSAERVEEQTVERHAGIFLQ
jgi:hypothetical protein